MFQRIFLAIAVAALSSVDALRADEAGLCPQALTQSEMNECAGGASRTADAELNRVYNRILQEHAHDPVFIEKLRTAQRAWLIFRDAQLDALYPHTEDGSYYGSVFPMCIALIYRELTVQRTNDLRKWLEGVPEGEVCAGSVRFRR